MWQALEAWEALRSEPQNGGISLQRVSPQSRELRLLKFWAITEICVTQISGIYLKFFEWSPYSLTKNYVILFSLKWLKFQLPRKIFPAGKCHIMNCLVRAYFPADCKTLEILGKIRTSSLIWLAVTEVGREVASVSYSPVLSFSRMIRSSIG